MKDMQTQEREKLYRGMDRYRVTQTDRQTDRESSHRVTDEGLVDSERKKIHRGTDGYRMTDTERRT
jgi:hypothetical protein